MSTSFRRLALSGLAVTSLLAMALAGGGAATAAGSGPVSKDACDKAAVGYARCLAKVRVDGAATARRVDTAAGVTEIPAGYGAPALRAAYKVPKLAAKSLVAVVIAFDVPHAEADLGVYRAMYGLSACTTANGCFRKVNQDGAAAPLPQPDGGWAIEGSMDIQMVSAACPTCRILLVEGNSNSFEDLSAATARAVAMGATVISHSYGGDEWGGMWATAAPYRQPGVISVASSGDWGFTTASAPAVLPGVLAVGGTSLFPSSNARGWTEDAWDGAGSGCSAYVKKPTYQKDPNCSMRTVADVSVVADPNTGVAVYDSYENPFIPAGWMVLGGTSASAPFVAGLIGAKGDGATFRVNQIYNRKSSFFDVVGGSNGFCGGDYLCTGLKGYDAPTGIGSPKGLAGL